VFLVTGATGRVGHRIVRNLVARGARVRALVRDAHQGEKIVGTDVELAVGDFMQPDTLDGALKGVEAAIMIAPRSMKQVQSQSAFIDAAQRNRLPRLAMLSMIGADRNSPSPIAYWHAMAEERIAASRVPCTILRPNVPMQTLLAFAADARSDGVLRIPAGVGRAALIDEDDIAEASASALADPGHVGACYTLTGPAALSFEEIAAELTAASGRTITYAPIPPADLKPRAQEWSHSGHYADAIVAVWRAISFGRYDMVTNDVERLTQRPAKSFHNFAQESAVLFRGEAANNLLTPANYAAAACLTAAAASTVGLV
jgi:uncharacterized protein YbjT (DUF2867 family)